MDLHIIWFILLGVLLTGYAILDGFDLGVGILHPVARSDHERRVFINAIGPIWDGNEVWLVTFGGALFAAFPEAYATIFSAFYTAFMLVLTALISRAAAIEFRSKISSKKWRAVWDGIFFLASLLAALLFGVAVGNGVIGIPLNQQGVFTGSLFDQLKPYPLMVGLLTVAMFAMHGALYLNLKISHGELHQRIGRWIWHTWGVFLVLYVLTTMYTLVAVHRAVPNFVDNPWAAAVVVLNVLAVANIPRSVFTNRPGQAFISSCITIIALVTLFSIALWPNLVTASNNPDYSISIYRAASSHRTLQIMFIIACIGMPLVLTYTALIYWTFRRRVEIGPHSY
ncbi:MAG TPA: cytochrome d ubiquinol oxidase subunit II [Tepidisphaeraceae bacterium]|nr:cytochrome d ubiquinol oxidase subunit II [Tepidisphaeraceae bacterium]